MAWDISVGSVKQKGIDGFWAVKKAVVSKEAAIGTVCAGLVGATYAYARGTSYLNASVIGGGTGLVGATAYNLYKGSKPEGGDLETIHSPSTSDEDERSSAAEGPKAAAATTRTWMQTLTFGFFGGESKPKVNPDQPPSSSTGGDGNVSDDD